jgi:hypothetical protein
MIRVSLCIVLESVFDPGDKSDTDESGLRISYGLIPL